MWIYNFAVLLFCSCSAATRHCRQQRVSVPSVTARVESQEASQSEPATDQVAGIDVLMTSTDEASKLEGFKYYMYKNSTFSIFPEISSCDDSLIVAVLDYVFNEIMTDYHQELYVSCLL